VIHIAQEDAMKQLHKPFDSSFKFSMSDLNHIIVEELRRGKTQDDLIAYLQKRGWPLTTAEHFVRNAAFSEAVANQNITEQQLTQPSARATSKSWRAALVWMLALMGLAVMLVDFISRGMPF
jgi:hypothetical protein